MSVKTTITDNSITSAVVGGKTLTRRTEGDQVIYDGFIDTSNANEATSGGGGIPFIDDGWNGPKTNNLISITAKTVSNNNGLPNEVRLTINTDQGSVALNGLFLTDYLPATKQGYMIPGNQP